MLPSESSDVAKSDADWSELFLLAVFLATVWLNGKHGVTEEHALPVPQWLYRISLRRPRRSCLNGSSAESGFDLVTFITVPRPQKHAESIKRSILHLKTWLSFPFVNVIMVSSESVYDPGKKVMPILRKDYGGARIRFVGDLPTGYENRPLVREWFKVGMRYAGDSYVCFVNADMTITKKWMNTAFRVFRSMECISDKTVIIGTRTGVKDGEWVDQIDVTQPGFEDKLAAEIANHSIGNIRNGMDLMMFHSSLTALNWDQIPDFVVGMCFWDNFVMGWAHKRCDTVTFNFNPQLWHINHYHYVRSACNQRNNRIFTNMLYRSPHSGGIAYHDYSRWRLDMSKEVLVSQVKQTAGQTVKLINLA